MPWRGYYRRRRRPWYRRRYYRFRRPRKTFWRRYRTRRWVRRKTFKKKLKKIYLQQYQPTCIRKCKIKGFTPLIQCTLDRIAFNYDMYELSTVPERLPGGGGFGIKAFNLEALYAEHVYGHNVWTKPNTDLPLVRYSGCKFKFYQSELTDYIVSYSISWPMQSNLGMYNTMQPSIHSMIQHKLIVPSRKTYERRKPYFIKKIKPPTQLQNKWYWQVDICKSPLVMIRTSAASLEHFYLHPNAQSSNITIKTLNTALIQHRNFKNPPASGYYASGELTQAVYLYTTRQHYNSINEVKIKNLVFLGNTVNRVEGSSLSEIYPGKEQEKKDTWKTEHKKHWGNPFYPTYLTGDGPVFQSKISYPTYLQKLDNNIDNIAENITEVKLVHDVRYNPFNDKAQDQMCYFLSNNKQETGWEPPEDSDLTNERLPIWLLLFGFPDFQKKIKKLKHIDDEYILTIIQEHTRPIRNVLVPLNESFINGNSPYENTHNIVDIDRWYPQFQFQQEVYNNICISGPGTPKPPKGTNIEAKAEYTFYFKWGGELPPMSTIEDPKNQPFYPVPNNQLSTNSLQNPASAPERLLYSFDQRRDTLTKKALQRIQKDYGLKESFITDGANQFSETPQIQQESSSEESSQEEEETETLLRQLHKQRQKQRQLKYRILQRLKLQQSLE
nr:MAG: ORF1 [TTV-like mini virus]